MDSWQPTASIETLRHRAELLAKVRAFFADRDVLEVDTQCLSKAAVSDPFIDTLEVAYRAHATAETEWHYLQSSPEHAMKRLLAAHSGPIYQLGKVFRNGELGRLHNPEFTLLEWYRPGFSGEQLMDEVQDLLSELIGSANTERLSYRQLFLRHLGIDPHQASLQQLKALMATQFDCQLNDDRKDTWLELLMSHLIEPHLIEPIFVYDFPASQAAMAQIRTDREGISVAARFELYAGGMELANGYQELRDPDEQSQRLAADQAYRRAQGMPQRPQEHRLIDALRSGIPECAGVALGFDRLLMLKLGLNDIQQVIPFGFASA